MPTLYFKKSNNKIVLRNGSTVEDLMTVLHSLEEEKHANASGVQDCLLSTLLCVYIHAYPRETCSIIECVFFK